MDITESSLSSFSAFFFFVKYSSNVGAVFLTEMNQNPILKSTCVYNLDVIMEGVLVETWGSAGWTTRLRFLVSLTDVECVGELGWKCTWQRLYFSRGFDCSKSKCPHLARRSQERQHMSCNRHDVHAPRRMSAVCIFGLTVGSAVWNGYITPYDLFNWWCSADMGHGAVCEPVWAGPLCPADLNQAIFSGAHQ